ncbi:MAG: amidohydrolase [Chloroflexi bacterium]|nr:amidohydrolase [Chloroflexota bacterium]
MIVDAHAHIMREVHGQTQSGATRSLDCGKISWGTQTLQLMPPSAGKTTFPAEALLANLDWAGVERAVLLQGPFYGDVNALVAEASARWPQRVIGAAYLDPWQAEARAVFEKVIVPGGFRAVKLECSEATGLCGLYAEARLDGADVAWLWPALAQHGLTLTLDLGAVGSRSYQTDAVREIAQQHPTLKIVIAHLGQPNARVEADAALRAQWQAQIDLGRLANVWFDTASLVAYASAHEAYPFPSVERFLRQAVERIGAPRLLWGTDAPGTLIHATYKQYVALGQQHTAFLSPREQALVLGENALAVYG